MSNAECRKQMTDGTRVRTRERWKSVLICCRTNRYPMRVASAHEALPSCSQNRLRNDKVRAFSVAACVRKLRSVLR